MRPDEFADSLYRESPPPTLYHYTSLPGLLGILRSGTIWASEARYLNDSAELIHAFNLMTHEVRRRLAAAPGADEQEVLRQFGEWIEIRSARGPMVFVAAFTQHGNLLSQWRGYCPPTGGVSFGLASAHLAAACASTNFALGRCRYVPAEQVPLITNLVEVVTAFATRTGPADKAHPNQSYHPSFALSEEAILRVAVLMKNVRFQEEAEWRIVSRAVSDYVGTKISYRTGASMLVPYLEFSVTNMDRVIPIDDVIVGPTPHPEAATESVQRCVAQHMQRKHGPLTSQYCSIPYRSW